MYLYFFDLDDTICDTQAIVDVISKKHNVYKQDFKNDDDFYRAIDKFFYEYKFSSMPILHNSATHLLKKLIKTEPHNVFYLTARESKARGDTIKWLKDNNLHIGDNKLLMDARGIKGLTINNILERAVYKDFAMLFDDLIENHLEASKYKNIISCYPY